MELTRLAFTVQALAAPPVALLVVLLARAVPRPFLRHWAVGWVALAAALLTLRTAFFLPRGILPTGLFTSAYYCLEYLFGYLVWVGCRELVGRPGPRWPDAWVLGPAMAFGLIAPWVADRVTDVFPVHAPLFGSFFLLALAATRGYRRTGPQFRFGIHVVRLCLLLLGGLFVHYGPVSYATLRLGGAPPAYMLLSPMYDTLVEVGLAFGMALVAVEQVRDQLDAANHRLADMNLRLAESNSRLEAASGQLEVAARTDALTGLLNRRALDALLAARQGTSFSGAVAVVDMNSLKYVNDTHGHEAGDVAIKLVARALRANFRISDPVFRTGGDEFVALAEGGRSADLTERLVAVDESLRHMRLPGLTAPVDLVVAWGLADFGSPAEFPAALARADQAMYAEKARRKAAARV
ncbi:MAG: GGDEF domain-containing protein [Gemmataceae bacterium]